MCGETSTLGIRHRIIAFIPQEMKILLFLEHGMGISLSLLAYFLLHLLLLQCCPNLGFPVVYSAHSKPLPNLLHFFSPSPNLIISSPPSSKSFSQMFIVMLLSFRGARGPGGTDTAVVPPNRRFLSLQTHSLFRCWLYVNIPGFLGRVSIFSIDPTPLQWNAKQMYVYI